MKLPLQNQPSTTTLSARLVAYALAATFAGFGSVHAQGHKTNTSTGLKAGSKVTTGKNNTADGFNALLKNKTGQFNTAVGSKALKKNTGSSNVAIGFEALFKNKAGQFNVAIGDGAMKFNVTGNNNVALGMDAGSLTTGSDNILIDHQGVDGESGKIRIGTPGTHSDTFLSGVVHGNGSGLTGVTATSVSGSISGGQITAGTITSTALAPTLNVTNRLGVGVAVPSAKLHVNSAVGEDGLRVQLAGTTKLRVHSNGGVSVGTPNTPPANGLAVNGDVKLGTSATLFAPASEENLRIVRGEMDTVGSKIRGAGFTSTNSGVGVYVITFSPAFASIPTVTANALDVSNSETVTYSNQSTSSITLRAFDQAGAPTNSVTSFIAIGPR
jgi:hypothetical protein